MITIYTMPSCGHCHDLVAYMEEQKRTFTIVDCSQDQEKATAIIKKTGQYEVPIMMINEGTEDEKYLIGFNKQSVVDFLTQYYKG